MLAVSKRALAGDYLIAQDAKNVKPFVGKLADHIPDLLDNAASIRYPVFVGILADTGEITDDSNYIDSNER